MRIGGDTASAGAMEVVDPCTGSPFATVSNCSLAELEDVMRAAAGAWITWRRSEDDRVHAILALADTVEASADELTMLLSRETGKPHAVAANETAMVAPWLRYYAQLQWPRSVLQDDADAHIEVVHRPVGVVAAITPWNFPLGLSAWKLAPALRAGNTVVLKPSPYAPLAVRRLGELMNEVLPAGVATVVTGDDDIGSAMVAHPTPRKVSFTGSVSAGKHVAASAGRDLKLTTLELGGNDAAILLDDIDIERTAQQLVGISFYNTGQACALPKRVFAPQSLFDDVVEALVSVARRIIVGAPDEGEVSMGPLTTAPQFQRVSSMVKDAVEQGAHAASGGHALDRTGYFYEPTILTQVTDGMRVVADEQFGPVLPVLTYGSSDEAVARANATTFGLCGSVWSADTARARSLASQLECGTVFVNGHVGLRPDVPFGGIKWSGLGMENGLPGLLAFTQPQVLHTTLV